MRIFKVVPALLGMAILAVGAGAASATSLAGKTMNGTSRADTLTGTNQTYDTINGYSGNDRLSGLALDDVLRGGSGSDYLAGGRGSDTLIGGPGADELRGGTGRDSLRGGDGNDLLVSFASDSADNAVESLDCGAGQDVAYVGPGDTATGCETIFTRNF